MWGATPFVCAVISDAKHISIHAPRVGSDFSDHSCTSSQCYFNPRSPCGERQRNVAFCQPFFEISIHAPRVGSDFAFSLHRASRLAFQSTLPVWGATRQRGEVLGQHRNFNPRSPCGERPVHPSEKLRPSATFQSTLPVWGATYRKS